MTGSLPLRINALCEATAHILQCRAAGIVPSDQAWADLKSAHDRVRRGGTPRSNPCHERNMTMIPSGSRSAEVPGCSPVCVVAVLTSAACVVAVLGLCVI